MSRVDVEDLKEGDLVVVEAEISRFSTAEPIHNQKTWQDQSKARKKGFATFKSMFELSSISLLKAGPEEVELSNPGPSSSRMFAVSI